VFSFASDACNRTRPASHAENTSGELELNTSSKKSASSRRMLHLLSGGFSLDIGNEAANPGCIRELLSIACGRTFRVGCAQGRLYGTCRLSNLHPGLRPGLSSAVPPGLCGELSRGKRWLHPISKSVPQGLKPDVFSMIYGPTKVVP